MNYAKKIKSSPILYSCCSGHNFYFTNDTQQYEVFSKPKRIVEHVKTGEKFYIMPIPENLGKEFSVSFWKNLIQKPVDLLHYIWPVDIISFPKTSLDIKYLLVFPIRALPAYDSIFPLFTNDMQAGWDKPWVRDLTKNLLVAWKNLDESGYLYHEFSVENMFRQKDGYNVMFDFSFSTQITNDMYTPCFVHKNKVSPEFTDPYYYSNKSVSQMDRASDYYTMAVFLFKLLIGRFPYQGKIIEHEANSDSTEHESWLKIYHRNTYFIFDEKDNINQIGGETGFAKDDLFVERWQNLPEHVRNMFHNEFQVANVQRKAKELFFYSPTQWYDALFGEPSEVKLIYRSLDLTPTSSVSK